MKTSPKFWDRIASKYAKRPVADQASYEHKLTVTQGYFQPDWQLLEIGCGTGTTALIHAPKVRHIRATDISEQMLAIARVKAADQDIENVSFEQASMETLEVEENSMDGVLALSLLHLLEDKDAAIKQIYRMLKPGGIFVSSTACLGDGMRWFMPIGWLGNFVGLIPMVKFFTGDELEHSLRTAGFDIEVSWRPGPKKALFLVARKPA